MRRTRHPTNITTGKRCLCFLLTFILSAMTLFVGFTAAGSVDVKAAEASQKAKAFDPFAEGASYSCVLYNNTNGLSTSEANAITQTNDGFIWIGSYGGLVRYDGIHFKRKDSLLGISSVVCLMADKKDRLWFGSNDSGLAMLYHDEVTHWGVDDGLKSLSVNSIVEDTDGTIFVGTKDGIYTIDDSLKLHPLSDSRISHFSVAEMKIGSDGLIYCLSLDNHLAVLKGENIVQYYNEDMLPVVSANCLLPDKDHPGYIYFGSDFGGLYYCDMNGEPQVVKVYSDECLKKIDSISYVEDRIWICASDKAIALDNGDLRVLENIPMNNEIHSVMADSEGNLWFTSTRQGVMKLMPNRFTNVFENYQLDSEVVNATCIYDEKLFIGTDTGLTVIDKNGVCETLKLKNSVVPDGTATKYTDLIKLLKGHRIRSLTKDSRDRMWIAVWTGLGLLCYDHGSLKMYTIADDLINNKVREICEMRDGSIVVATNAGISILKDDQVVRSYSKFEGLENPLILTVAECADGEIIAGSDGGGIYVINGDKVETLSLSDGLTSDTILNIKPDHKRDILWVITSNSIAYMTRDHQITTIEKFPYTNNFDIIQNSKDEMWVLSSNGIYIVRTEEMLQNEDIHPAHITTSNGLFCTSTPNSRSYVAENGDCYLAGNDGVVKVNIETGLDTAPDYKISVPFIDADDSRLYPDENGSFKIPFNTKTLTVYGFIFSYSLITPKVSYCLEGFSDEYVTIDFEEMGPVVYTNLGGGKYSFVLKTTDPIGDDEQSVSVTIVKEISLFESPWFYILAGIAAIVIIVVSVRTFVNKKVEKMQRKHQEEVEKERIQSELNTATQIQADMLPRDFPAFPERKEFELFASMDPAKEVGGDFYDFFLIDDDHIALVMADVSGKGVPAALFMVNAKTLIKNRALMGGGPAEILDYVNEKLSERNKLQYFVTVWLAIVDLTTGKGLAANAGHEHPSLRRKGGEFDLVIYNHSPGVAMFESMLFREHPFELKPGDTLFVYTDGVPEATDNENNLFGTDRMLAALNRDTDADPETLLRTVRKEIDDFVGGAPQFDDITMLAFRYHGSDDPV